MPIPLLTVIATVGGVAHRALVRDGQVVVRPMLPMTLSFDHGVVDGGPASRFVETLCELTESAAALPAPPQPAPASSRANETRERRLPKVCWRSLVRRGLRPPGVETAQQ